MLGRNETGNAYIVIVLGRDNSSNRIKRNTTA